MKDSIFSKVAGLLPGVFKCENTTLQSFPGGTTCLLENECWGSSYFPVNSYWEVRFSGKYLLIVKTGRLSFQVDIANH